MAKWLIPPLSKDRIRLRLLEKSDLPMTLGWRNQDHIRKWFIHSDVISPEQHQEWFEHYIERADDYVFIIEEICSFIKPVGQISLYNIEWDDKKTELGRLMIGSAEARGRGLAKKANQLLIEFVFHQWTFVEIYIHVLQHNAVVISLYRELGFQIAKQFDNLVLMRALNAGLSRKA
jgi:RimJ/RimL family protein N-acetyltransferase